jgi:hypothetical protein
VPTGSNDRYNLHVRGFSLLLGSIESNPNHYFDKSCFTTPPVIGADGIGTTFGNSGIGIVDGPEQANLDLAISKLIPFDVRHEECIQAIRALCAPVQQLRQRNRVARNTIPSFNILPSKIPWR